MYQRLLLSKSDDATICSSPHPTRPVFWKDLSTALTREYSHANGMLDHNAFPGFIKLWSDPSYRFLLYQERGRSAVMPVIEVREIAEAFETYIDTIHAPFLR